MSLLNPTPKIHQVNDIKFERKPSTENDRDEIDALEIYEMIRTIKDPEHPFSLEQLNVVQLKQIDINDAKGTLIVYFTPTITGCSMATLIGLCIHVKLLRYLPRRFKIQVYLKPGSHSTEEAVNKQLNDKERVAAALENPKLLSVVDQCLDGVSSE